MNKNKIFVLAAIALLTFTTGCPKIIKDKSGIDAAIQDMERLYTRVDALKTAARQKNKPALTNDTEILIAYNDAAGFLNGYWKGTVGDVESGQRIDRSRKAYTNEHGYGNITNFFGLTEKKLREVDARESGEAVLIAKIVIDVMDYFFKRADKLEEQARTDFKAYLNKLKVEPWGVQFKMPEEPKFYKEKS